MEAGAIAAAHRRERRPEILTLAFGTDTSRPFRVLAVGAHCDDIEIGAGGTLLEWVRADVPIAVDWVVMTSTPERAAEARAAAETFLEGAASHRVIVHSFRDGFLPHDGAAVKEAFEELKALVSPDVILTHSREDAHQDHRLVSELTWNTFRDHAILEYEIPKYDGDLGRPNVFVGVAEENVQRKWEYLRDLYPSQAGRDWFTESTFRGLMRLRGVESRSASGYAEAFTARKVVLRPPNVARPADLDLALVAERSR